MPVRSFVLSFGDPRSAGVLAGLASASSSGNKVMGALDGPDGVRRLSTEPKIDALSWTLLGVVGSLSSSVATGDFSEALGFGERLDFGEAVGLGDTFGLGDTTGFGETGFGGGETDDLLNLMSLGLLIGFLNTSNLESSLVTVRLLTTWLAAESGTFSSGGSPVIF
jgi:hypothetical protein